MKRSARKTVPLEKNEVWQEVSSLADYFYGILADFPASEHYTAVSKIRFAVIDVLYSVSQGLGNASDSGREYDWTYAKKFLSGLKGIYIFSGKQSFIELDPQIVVRMDKLSKIFDEQIEQGFKDSNVAYKREIDSWKERYDSWKKLNEETNPKWMTGSK